ncbi:MAG TPA: M90 family metallopeptidase [Acidimicrobiia bacterium]|nr:M90 family metallopeptidase [Acidimicrobiia bacterium]
MRWPFARGKREPEPFPDEWRAVIARNVSHWRLLEGEERLRLEDLTWSLIDDKRWEAARGFELTDEIKVTIGAQATLLTLGFGDDAYFLYDDVTTIIVHPSTMNFEHERVGPARGTRTREQLPLLGEAIYRGPVIIAWDAALEGARHPERGHNVVYHEFAHRLDMLDGTVNGTPPLATAGQIADWVTVCTAEFEAVRDGTSGELLDAYAGTNPAEFFAVVTEVFFDQPLELEAHKPALYRVLKEFYRQDTAVRARRDRP